jgi:4-hydroxybutyrate CoA-transferase
MSDRYAELENVTVVHRIGMGECRYAQPGMEAHFRHISLFGGPNTRQAINSGRADYLPRFISETPALFINGIVPVDVALITVSAPDSHGYCSLGISVDYTLPAARNAKIVVAEVNENMPRTHGDSFMHVSDIQYFAHSSRDLMQIERSPFTEVEDAIGRYVNELIKDGDTLQLGIGAIPDAILSYLKGKHNLGIHTEMFSDGVMELTELGVINGSQKTLHKNKIVSTFMMGSKELYAWVNDNPFIEMHSEDYVNNPYIIGQNDNMVSINSALQVDVLGQVAADQLAGQQYSGVGGQVDYIRGIHLSRGGRSIIALPSTAAKGTVSRIVPALSRGTAVTTSRNEVSCIVTEYGIAMLEGKTNLERLKALVAVSHPDFRDEIRAEAMKLYYGA